jgi:hypothetical protein
MNLTDDAVRRARDRILHGARLMERRRFDHLFGSGSAADTGGSPSPVGRRTR